MQTIEERINDIKRECAHIEERENKQAFSGIKDQVHWSIKLGNNKPIEYSEGIGLFVKHSFKPNYMSQNISKMILGHAVKPEVKHDIFMQNDFKNYVTNRVKRIKTTKHVYAIPLNRLYISAPDIKDILYSLTMDADAINYTFDDWCDNYGYSNDSIQAKECFEACRDTYTIILTLGFELSHLQEYFQDY